MLPRTALGVEDVFVGFTNAAFSRLERRSDCLTKFESDGWHLVFRWPRWSFEINFHR